jgi:DNA-binding LytR/AlgR family response regulator
MTAVHPDKALTAIIIDDEPLAHDVLKHHIVQINANHGSTIIDLIYQGYSAVDALKWLSSHTADVLILDIKMPELTGIELVQVLANNTPQVIFVTAYQEYAVDGFELNAADYLLKPVSQQRLKQAFDKVLLRVAGLQHNHLNHSLKQNEPHNNSTSITLNLSGAKRKVDVSEIVWFEAYGNYVKVHLRDKVLLANSSFKGLLSQLPAIDLLNHVTDDYKLDAPNAAVFAQIHKSYGINLTELSLIENDHIELKDKTEIKVGKTYRKAVKALL